MFRPVRIVAIVAAVAATLATGGAAASNPTETVRFAPVAGSGVSGSATLGANGVGTASPFASPGSRPVVYRPTGWEIGAPALPLFAAGDYAGAKALLTAGLDEFPESPIMLYNLACAEARLGERDDALAHLVRAVALDARFAEYAQSDEDLQAIRDDFSFPGGAG